MHQYLVLSGKKWQRLSGLLSMRVVFLQRCYWIRNWLCFQIRVTETEWIRVRHWLQYRRWNKREWQCWKSQVSMESMEGSHLRTQSNSTFPSHQLEWTLYQIKAAEWPSFWRDLFNLGMGSCWSSGHWKTLSLKFLKSIFIWKVRFGGKLNALYLFPCVFNLAFPARSNEHRFMWMAGNCMIPLGQRGKKGEGDKEKEGEC